MRAERKCVYIYVCKRVSEAKRARGLSLCGAHLAVREELGGV